ncbi:MAG: hypothetical protein ABI147_02555 [Acidobacteriaceae bacterium]
MDKSTASNPSSISSSIAFNLSTNRTRAALLAASAVGLGLFALGCGIGPIANVPFTSQAAISGTIHGGQQPVAHASVVLYAPGTTGYGTAPTAIVSTTTDASGNFTLPRPYTCPANSGNVYIVSTGGDSGSGTNSVLAEAALLGPCSSLTASSFIFVSEVTTVAAAYALAPFASISGATTNIGTSATNLIGLNNANGPANNLANTVTGNARDINELPGMVLPTAEMNTLADILAACVNTNGGTGITAPCGMLFTAATPPGGAAPADTFQAAINIALNPGNNAAQLFALSTPTAPFQPTLATAPGDFAVAIQYTGGQIGGSQLTRGIAIDSKGNAWLGNSDGNTTSRSVSEISPAGVFLSGPNGFLNGIVAGNGYSIDASDNVFIAVANLNAIYELNSSGVNVNIFTPSSLQKPLGVAVDNRTAGIWTGNSNNTPSLNGGQNDFIGTTVSFLTSAGVDAAGSPYGGNNGPDGVQIDGLGNVWVANTCINTTTNGTNCSLAKYTPPATAGNPYTMQTFDTGNNSFPFDLLFDSANNVYVLQNNLVAKYNNAGTQTRTLTSAAANSPAAVMIDGLGRAFVSNSTSANTSTPGSLTVFSPTGTLLSTANGSMGYLANNTINNAPFLPTGMGIDPSGNVWITGINTSASPNAIGFVTEIIGVAAPILTPTTVQSSTNKYGVRP